MEIFPVGAVVGDYSLFNLDEMLLVYGLLGLDVFDALTVADVGYLDRFDRNLY